MAVEEDPRDVAFAVAYRILGSVADAEDIAQEAWVRLHGASDIVNRAAFATTIATRLAIDVLRSARAQRETYVGSWLPEPLVDAEGDASRRVEDDETISLAFLVLLERLGPVERAVLVLRDAFDYSFAEIATIVDRTDANCRQIHGRARRRIEDDRPRFDADPAQRRALADRFVAAARDGDIAGLVALLAADVVLVGDGGGIARSIPRPMVGADRVARALAGFWSTAADLGIRLAAVWVNGQPGFRATAADGGTVNVLAIDVFDGRIVRLHSMLNPEKLAHLGPTSTLALRPSQGSA